MSVYDDLEFSVTCDKCSEKILKTIGWLKANRRITCNSCGHSDFISPTHRSKVLKKTRKGEKAIERSNEKL